MDETRVSNPMSTLARLLMDRRTTRREVLLSLAALGVVGPALTTIGPTVSAQGRLSTLRLPEREPTVFDPALFAGAWGLEQLQNIFEGLVGIDQRDGALEMLMAERMTPNADASVWTFTLRDGMRWSDGVAIDAATFVWSWQRVLSPQLGSEYTSALLPIKGVADHLAGKIGLEAIGIRALDAKTLEVTLEGPTPFFPLLATTWTFYPVPRHMIEQHGDKWLDPPNLVSNGPYVLTEWVHDVKMVAEPNPNYWGPKPAVARCEWILMADPVNRALAPFEADEIDQAQVPGAELDRVRQDPALSQQMREFPRSGTAFVVCDVGNFPTSEVKFRQALSLAVGRDILATRVLNAEFRPAPTVLPADIPGNQPAAALGESLDRAKALIAEVAQTAPIPPITLVYDTANSTWKLACEYLQGRWKETLGLDVRLEGLAAQGFREWRRQRKVERFHLYFQTWGSDFGDASNWHNTLFAAEADYYFTRWQHADFNRLVSQARTLNDAKKRVELHEMAETILNRELPVIPLYYLNRFFVIKPHVKGVYHYPILGRTWLKYITLG